MDKLLKVVDSELVVMKKPNKIYFASPWFDDITSKLYDYIVEIVNKSSESAGCKVYFPREQQKVSPKETFKQNIDNLKDADTVIALISKKDTGTAFEIGMAFALNKPVILLGYDESCFNSTTNIMLAYAGDCITVDKLTKVLFNRLTQEDLIKMDNNWEGKE